MSSRAQRGGPRQLFANARITRGALYLLVAEFGMSLVFLLSGDEIKRQLLSWLSANAYQVWHELKLWTLITSALLQQEFISLVLHGFVLWMFIPTLERWWGTKKLLLFALWTSLAGTVVGTLLGLLIGDATPIAGLDPFIYASIVAFGVLYGDHPVQFFGVLPLTGRQLMLAIIGFLALFILLGSEWALGAAYAASMTLAWLMTSGKWTPRLWHLRLKHRRTRKHLRVVKDRDKDRRDKGDKQHWLN